MIVKVAKLDKSIKSSFKRLTEYITNEQVESDINIRNVGAWIEPDDIYDMNDLDLFIEDVESVQSMSNAKSDKTYHLIVSFGVDERPDIETLKNISNEFIESLGFKDHQRLSVIHDDTDNLHMHIAINKINPEKYTIHDPYYPYKTLSKKAKELDDNNQSKTDHRDARVIAQLVKDGRYTEPNLLDGLYEELREAAKIKRILTGDMVRTKNQITNWFDRYFPEYTKVYKQWDKKTLLWIIKKYRFPVLIARVDPEEVYQEIKKDKKKA